MPVTSNLYKISRMVNHEDFVARVAAASLLYAQANIGGPAGTSKNLATYTLINPMAPEYSMVALVASDPVVLQQVTLDGPVAMLGDLTDAEVSRVVAAKWALVSAKYPNDPTPKAGA